MREVKVFYADMDESLFMGTEYGTWAPGGQVSDFPKKYTESAVLSVPDNMPDLDAAELVFANLQRMDTENPYLEELHIRSMCMGDVVLVDGKTYIADSIGFTEVPASIIGSADV